MRSPTKKAMAAMMVALLLSCSPAEDGEDAIDQERVALGADLYQQNCASCHQPDLSGATDWMTPNEDGSFPPPPHDSSGHTWHHPDRVLIEIIRDGSDSPKSRMPAFGDRLSEADIGAILEFFKDNWGARERAYQREVTEQDTG